MFSNCKIIQNRGVKTHSYIVTDGHQSQILLHFIAVEGQSHVVSQLPQIRVQTWEEQDTKKQEMLVKTYKRWRKTSLFLNFELSCLSRSEYILSVCYWVSALSSTTNGSSNQKNNVIWFDWRWENIKTIPDKSEDLPHTNNDRLYEQANDF